MMNDSFTVVIPARYGSTRLPGKALLDIGGKPMVQWVWEQAGRSAADRVVVATDDQRIVDVAESFGAQVCLTSDRHPSGTDRLQEVASQMGFAEGHIVVNVQGDEPLIPPEVINQVAHNLHMNNDCSIATLCEPITVMADVLNPNICKVVFDHSGRARYFSRAPIPFPRDAFADVVEERRADLALPSVQAESAASQWHRHIGIYAYRARFLDDFVTWEAAPTETLEQLEQLRALHYGAAIHVAEAVLAVPGGVDTQADLEHVRAVVSQS